MDTEYTTRSNVLICEYGSQYTLKIESSNRELGFRSAIFEPVRAVKWIKSNPVKGIILSGGPQSVNDSNAPTVPDEIWQNPVPKLAICLGMQMTAKKYGGTVESVESQRGYSKETIEFDTTCELFRGLPKRQVVWGSHGDSVTKVPKGFRATAWNVHTGSIAAMSGHDESGAVVHCVQFHPEVHHTKFGKQMLLNFNRLSGATSDWQPKNIVDDIQEGVLLDLNDRIALVGGSGGVDSTTLVKILSPVLSNRLHVVLIDGGQLREGEVEEARSHVEAAGGRLNVVNAHARFAYAFQDTIDAEQVRAVFRRLYAEIMLEEAFYISNGDLSKVALLQGTLAPDRIESGATGGALIKTHHNVNLDTGMLVQLHPLADLFKYEVRVLARKLGLPKSVSERHPFPGPGEFIRLPGLRKTPGNLEIVRWIDREVTVVLKKHGWFHRISQLIPTYEGVMKVGVKGDGRVYQPVACVRAVRTTDFMTAEGIIFPKQVIREIETVLTRHPNVSRVHFDSTNKPPATTEAE